MNQKWIRNGSGCLLQKTGIIIQAEKHSPYTRNDRQMNYNHLVYFQKLAKYEHYRKAAEELHITQPSLSNAIHALETDLGVKLFEKKGRGVRLTKQGSQFLEYVNNALHELNMGTELLHYEQISSGGVLNLGIVMSVAYDRFPGWITDFRKQTGREIFFSCVNDTSDALILELKSGLLDLIICSRVRDPGIEFATLFEQQLVLMVPRSHRFARRNRVRVKDLDGENFIAHSRTTALHDIMADIFMKNQTHVKIVSEADEDRAILGMVRAGLGCGVTTYSPEIYGTDFAAVPIIDSGFEGQICVGRRVNTPLSGPAQDFYDFLVKEKHEKS